MQIRSRRGYKASPTSVFVRDLGAFLRTVQAFKRDAAKIDAKYSEHRRLVEESKKRGKPITVIYTDLERQLTSAWNGFRRYWSGILDTHKDVIDQLPIHLVEKVDLYILEPKLGEVKIGADSLYEWLYLLFKAAQNLKTERKIPARVRQQKPSSQYKRNQDLVDDFGQLLTEVTRSKEMLERDLPKMTDGAVLLPQPEHRDPRLRNGFTQSQVLLIAHHVSRIERIRAMWRKLNHGITRVVQDTLVDGLNERKDGGESVYRQTYIAGYADLLKQLEPLVRDLNNKYMVNPPNVKQRTFKQARYVVLQWYAAVESRVIRLYQFLRGFVAARAIMMRIKMARPLPIKIAKETVMNQPQWKRRLVRDVDDLCDHVCDLYEYLQSPFPVPGYSLNFILSNAVRLIDDLWITIMTSYPEMLNDSENTGKALRYLLTGKTRKAIQAAIDGVEPRPTSTFVKWCDHLREHTKELSAFARVWCGVVETPPKTKSMKFSPEIERKLASLSRSINNAIINNLVVSRKTANQWWKTLDEVFFHRELTPREYKAIQAAKEALTHIGKSKSFKLNEKEVSDPVWKEYFDAHRYVVNVCQMLLGNPQPYSLFKSMKSIKMLSAGDILSKIENDVIPQLERNQRIHIPQIREMVTGLYTHADKLARKGRSHHDSKVSAHLENISDSLQKSANLISGVIEQIRRRFSNVDEDEYGYIRVRVNPEWIVDLKKAVKPFSGARILV